MSILSTITNIASGGQAALYKYGAIAAGILALSIGSYFYGVHTESFKSKATIATYQDQRDKALLAIQALQSITNTQVVTKFVTRTQVIHDHAEQIKNEIDSLTDTAVLSAQWVRLYDDSIDQLSVTPSQSDGEATGIKATTALSGITDNNATCLAYKAQLEALQDWETQTQANITQAQKK